MPPRGSRCAWSWRGSASPGSRLPTACSGSGRRSPSSTGRTTRGRGSARRSWTSSARTSCWAPSGSAPSTSQAPTSWSRHRAGGRRRPCSPPPSSRGSPSGARSSSPGGCARSRTPRPWLCLTGTNGKTTTVGMLESMLVAAGAARRAAGNVGAAARRCRARRGALRGARRRAVQLPAALDALPAPASRPQSSTSPRTTSTGTARWTPTPPTRDGSTRNTKVACVYNVADPRTEELVREADVEEGCRAIGFTLGSPVGGHARRWWRTCWSTGPSSRTGDRAAAELGTVADVRPSGSAQRRERARRRGARPRLRGLAGGGPRRAASLRPRRRTGSPTWPTSRGAPTSTTARRRTRTRRPPRCEAYDSVVWLAGGLAKGATLRRRSCSGSRAGSAASSPIGTDGAAGRRSAAATRARRPGRRGRERRDWSGGRRRDDRGGRAAARRSPARGTPCCSRLPAPPWTSSATTPSAATSSPPSSGRGRSREPDPTPGARGVRSRAGPARSGCSTGRSTSYLLVLGSAVALLGLGLPMVLSASSVTSYAATGSSFALFERQLMWAGDRRRRRCSSRRGCPSGCGADWPSRRMALALLLLVLVLVPGIGVEVNGNRNWIDFGGPFRLQPAEAAKLALVALGRRGPGPRSGTASTSGASCSSRSSRSRSSCSRSSSGEGTSARPWCSWRSPAGCSSSRGRRSACSRCSARRRSAVRGVPVRDRTPPPGPFRHLAEPVARRPAGQRPPVPARPLRAGQRRLVGPRAGGQPGEVGPAPRGAHRLHLRRHRRGARAGRDAHRAAALRRPRLRRRTDRASAPPTRSSGWPPSGATAWIGTQALVNIGAVLGLLPIAGLPLPLVSYGGAALLITLVAIGMLMSFARTEPGAAEALQARRAVRSQRWHAVLGSLQPGSVTPVHVVLAGGGTAGHVEPALAVADALRGPRPGDRHHRAGDGAWPREHVGPGPWLRPRTDLAGADARADPASTSLRVPGRLRAAGARGQRRARVGPRPTSWSGSAATSPAPAYLAARRMQRPVRRPRGQRSPRPRQPAGRATHAVGRRGRPGCTAARALRRCPAAPRGRPPGPGRARAPTPERGSGSTLTCRHCWSPAARRARGASTRRPPGRRPRSARPGSRCCTRRARRTTSRVDRSPGDPPYIVVPYLERMDLAYAAADLMLCRAGAMTCAELAAVGLPAVYVPLPIGNGEQRLNARPVVDAGGGLVVDDAACTPGYVAEVVRALAAGPGAVGGDGGRGGRVRPA